MIKSSQRIVFFGGAGVSTESGIPDFRSTSGLYNQLFDYPPEVIISRDYFFENTVDFYRFYRSKMVNRAAEPNPAHLALAKLEAEGKLVAVITQNIDGLHQKAGSKNVLELHGSVHRNFCLDCRGSYDVSHIVAEDSIPTCHCGGIVKPDVVLYGEELDNKTIRQAVNYVKNADMLIVGGTSLQVYPAAGLVNFYRGDRLVLINNSETPYDGLANLILRGAIGEVLGEAVLGL